jgi:AraC-like DNA-binding protein
MSTMTLPTGGAAPGPRPGVHALDTRDVDHLAVALRGWDYRLEQLGRGPFLARLRLAPLGPLQIMDAEVNLPLHARGLHAAGAYVFTVVEPANAGARWRGRHLRPGMVNVLRPGEETNHASTADYRVTNLLVPGDLFRRACAGALRADPDRLLAVGTPQIGPERGAALAARWRGLTAAAAGLPADPTDLVVHCVRTLAAGRFEEPSRTTPAARLRVVREAQEFARSAPPEDVTILKLCELTDVSARTLHYAFVEVLGLTPKAYFKALRLNAARRDLARTEPGRGRVEVIARRHGFTHLGGFAQDFRRQFGALPSAVLGSRTG